MPTLNRWQNPDTGFPTEAYIDAVEVELKRAGIEVAAAVAHLVKGGAR